MAHNISPRLHPASPDIAHSTHNLRLLAADFLGAHIARFRVQLLALYQDMLETGEITMQSADNDAQELAVIGCLRHPNTWGGSECVEALAHCLERTIEVCQLDGSLLTFHGDQPAGGRPIRIFHSGEHFDSVLAVASSVSSFP